MKLATLATSVLVLSASLMSGTAYAQTANLVVMPGAKTCWINGQQIFNCHYVEQRYYKRVPPVYPPTFDPVDPTRFGNEGGGSEKGDRGGRGSRKP